MYSVSLLGTWALMFFFVISGYLMTKIIVEKLEHNNFSFVDFYLSRIIRTYPALLFLVLVLTALGLFVLSQKI